MKLVYFARCFDTTSSNVDKKIASQVFYLKRLGIDASILTIAGKDHAQTGNRDIRFIDIQNSSKSRFRIINILLREHFIIRSLWEVICQLNSDDILYMRFNYPFFSWWYFMRKKRKCKVVFEHQSLESHEYILNRKFFYPILDYIFGGSIRWHCDGIVGVTDEITKYQLKRSGNPRKPHTTIGNGINVDKVPMKIPLSFDDSHLQLLCVGGITKWLGLERVIHGMKEYKGRTKIYLHVVGDGVELHAIKKMVNDLSINDAVFFHGPLHRKDLDEIFNRCDIAVGSLGIHRLGLHEASVLKVREYCARGIPFIYGIDDLDFPPDFLYVLHIPTDESPVDMAEVIRFAKAVYSDLSFSIKMREYAKKSLDWSFKAIKLKQFLDVVA